MAAQSKIIGVGIDLLEVARMRRDLEDKEGLRERLFTFREIEYCRTKRYPAQHFAARFCAKEAALKALGTGYREGLSWQEIEIEQETTGKPRVRLSGKVKKLAEELGVRSIFISLSHTREFAIAQVMLQS